MSILYADPSALARAYFRDEPGHEALHALLFESGQPVITSELSTVEFASAVGSSFGRTESPAREAILASFAEDCGPEGPISLIDLRPEPVLSTARELVLGHQLRALDAIHLAVAIEDGRRLAGDGELVFVTRDRDQAAAAAALGLTVG